MREFASRLSHLLVLVVFQNKTACLSKALPYFTFTMYRFGAQYFRQWMTQTVRTGWYRERMCIFYCTRPLCYAFDVARSSQEVEEMNKKTSFKWASLLPHGRLIYCVSTEAWKFAGVCDPRECCCCFGFFFFVKVCSRSQKRLLTVLPVAKKRVRRKGWVRRMFWKHWYVL